LPLKKHQKKIHIIRPYKKFIYRTQFVQQQNNMNSLNSKSIVGMCTELNCGTFLTENQRAHNIIF